MKHKPAIFALVRLHRDIAIKIVEAKAEAKRLAGDLRHVEAVLLMLEPGYDLSSIIPRKRSVQRNPWFRRGACLQAALDILRVSDKALTSRQIALRAAKERGLDLAEKDMANLARTIHVSLRWRRGKSVEVLDDAKPWRWRLIQP